MSFHCPLFASGRKPLRCRIQGQKGQIRLYQQAARVWEVIPHLPHGHLEHDGAREQLQSLPSSCIRNTVQAKLLQPVAVFIPALWSLLSYCSDHRGKKAAVFLSQGCPYAQGCFRDSVMCHREGCPLWDIRLKAGQKLDGASFGFSDSNKEHSWWGWLLLEAMWGMRGHVGRGCLSFHVQTQLSSPQPCLQWATWFCSLGKATRDQLSSAAAWFACALQ